MLVHPARRPQLSHALVGYLPSLTCALFALLNIPLLSLPSLWLANALGMAATMHALGRSPPPWNFRTFSATAAHLIRFASYSALVLVLLIWPLLWMHSAPGLVATLLLTAALMLGWAAALPFWPRFVEVFETPLVTPPPDANLGEVIATRFQRRPATDSRHFLSHALPAALILLLLALGMLGLSGLLQITWLHNWQAPLVPVYFLILVCGNLLLARLTRHLGPCGVPLANEESAATLQTLALPPIEPPPPSPTEADLTPSQVVELGEQLLGAARHGSTDEALQLLDTGAPCDPDPAPDAPDRRGILALAAVLSDTRLLRALIAAGTPVNRLRAGLGALHAATRDSWHGREEVVLVLLTNGADPRLPDGQGHTPLHGAALAGNPNVAAMLLDAYADIDAVDNHGLTPLALACRGANWPLVEYLLQHGASPLPVAGEPVLHAACGIAEDDVTGVRLLLRHHADPNTKDHLGRTALLTACLEGHTSIVRVLLAAGADVHITDRNGTTALMEAARAGASGVLELLSSTHPDIQARDLHGRDALCLACQSPRVNADTVQQLLNLGADPHTPGPDGRSALDHTCAAGRWDLLAVLDPHAALPTHLIGITEPEPGADTPEDLANALRYGHWAVAATFVPLFRGWTSACQAQLFTDLSDPNQDAPRAWLLEHGLDAEAHLSSGVRLFDALVERLPDTLDALQNLLLAGASPAGTGLLARILTRLDPNQTGSHLVPGLLERGADPFGADAEGRTPLSLAAAVQQMDWLEPLLAYGVNPNQCDLRGRNALHHALERPTSLTPTLVRHLIAHGGDPECVNDCGETPLGLALATGEWDLVHWLRWDGDFSLPLRPLRAADMVAAAKSGDLAAVKRLQQLGFDIDSRDSAGASALLHACGAGHDDVAEFLLATGADYRLAANNGVTCLAAAVLGRQPRLAQRLLDMGAQPDRRLANQATALHFAVARGSHEMIELLLQHGADIHAVNQAGQDALMIATRHAYEQGDSLRARRVFDVLLTAGASPRRADTHGTTALLFLLGAHAPPGQDGDATHIGALLPSLLAAGALIGAADSRGVSPLHACALHALLAPARMLLTRGASRQALDSWGRQPVDVARRLGYVDLARELEV